MLINKPILTYPDFDKPFVLSTDASNVGVGAVLSQVDAEGRERPVYYAGRSLSQAERNYSTIEREMLAIVYATEKFKYYLYGLHFVIYTDHNPLVHWKNLKLTSERLTRWRLKQAEYDFEVMYRKGALNGNADSLSRIDLPITPDSSNVLENLLVINENHKTIDRIKYKQENILQSNEDIAIAFTTSSDLPYQYGLPFEVGQKYTGNGALQRQERTIGSCLKWSSKRNIFSLIKRHQASDKPTIENLKSCLQSLKAECKRKHITKIAFAKYKYGLDKLEWASVSKAINQTLTTKISNATYTSTRR